MAKWNKVTISLIKDLPQETQDWLKNLKPPKIDNSANYTLKKGKGKK